MSVKVDFAVQHPARILMPLRDFFGIATKGQQMITLEFMDSRVRVQISSNRYRTKYTAASVLMTPGYLRSYHGFRVATKIFGNSTTLFLIDLHEVRPDSHGSPMWSHKFHFQKMLLTRVLFSSLSTMPNQTANMIVDCVPNHDKCAGENPCFNGGTCSENTCKCKPGYKGKLCDVDYCFNDACKNGKHYNSYPPDYVFFSYLLFCFVEGTVSPLKKSCQICPNCMPKC